MTGNHRRARALRKTMPEVEQLVWTKLRDRRFQNFKFRRQFPFGAYVVDFICLERRLIIELDGGQHTLRRNYDAERTRWLESQNFRVLRFWNYEVVEDWDTVAEGIWNALQTGGSSAQ